MADKTMVTPRGVLKYPFLTKARDYKGDGKFAFDTGFVVAGAAAAELIKQLDELMLEAQRELKAPNGKPPYKPVLDEDGNIVPGTFEVKFRCNALWPDGSSRAPALWNAKGEPVTGVKLGGGTEARIRFTPYARTYQGTSGVQLQPRELQILKLVEYSGGAQGFAADPEADYDGTGSGVSEPAVPPSAPAGDEPSGDEF